MHRSRLVLIGLGIGLATLLSSLRISPAEQEQVPYESPDGWSITRIGVLEEFSPEYYERLDYMRLGDDPTLRQFVTEDMESRWARGEASILRMAEEQGRHLYLVMGVRIPDGMELQVTDQSSIVVTGVHKKTRSAYASEAILFSKNRQREVFDNTRADFTLRSGAGWDAGSSGAIFCFVRFPFGKDTPDDIAVQKVENVRVIESGASPYQE